MGAEDDGAAEGSVMPFYIKIDFRKNARLGAWHSREIPDSVEWNRLGLTTQIDEVRVRNVLIALADEIDPLIPDMPTVEALKKGNKKMRKLSLMAYGSSGVGKTTQFRYLARYVHEKLGMRSRFICTDGGSLWECVQDYIDAGFVDALLVPSSPQYNPYAVMRKLGKGMWPKGSVINLPTAVRSGSEVKYQTNTVWEPWGEEQTKTIGLIGTDSLTGYSSAYMYDAAVKNIRRGSEAGGGVRDEEGEQYGSNTQSHYGDAQNEVKNYINSIVALPAPYAYFTALEDGGTENTTGSKVSVFGPQIAGSAATGELPKLVTNCFHIVADGVGEKRVVRAFYEEHPDPTLPPGKKWKAKASSILPEQRLEFVRKYPDGAIRLTLENGLREFLTVKDELDAKMAKVKGA